MTVSVSNIVPIFMEQFAIGCGWLIFGETSWYGPRKLFGVLKIGGGNARFFWKN